MLAIMTRHAQGEPGSVGDKLRKVRMSKGFTQTEPGALAGSSHRMIAYYEVQGGNRPANVVSKHARALDVSADPLLDRAKSTPSEAMSSVRLMRKLRLVEKLKKERKQVLALNATLVENQQLRKVSRT